MPGLPQLQLTEPLVQAIVTLLAANLNATIAQLNASVTDAFTVDPVVQFLDYVPVPSTFEGGLPAVGVQRLGGDFVDDLQSSMDAEHRYGVVVIVQEADQRTLARQLERTLECVAYTIQQDRVAGPASIMRTQGGVWSVNFAGYEPGPLLGDHDPLNPEQPPTSYLSWVALTLASKRTEV